MNKKEVSSWYEDFEKTQFLGTFRSLRIPKKEFYYKREKNKI